MSKSIKDLPTNQMYCKSSEIYFAQRHFPEKWENYPLEQIDDQFTRDLIDNKEVNVNASSRIVETMHNYLMKNKCQALNNMLKINKLTVKLVLNVVKFT